MLRTRDSDYRIGVPERPSSKLPMRLGEPGSAYRLDPTIRLQIAEIDPALVVEWRPLGRWWQGDRPPGASLGCWRVALRGRSGAIRGLMMWPPQMADGRLVDYLRAWWGEKVYILRSTTRTPLEKRLAMDRAQREFEARQAAEARQRRLDALDLPLLRRAIKSDLDPKWRGNWQVSA